MLQFSCIKPFHNFLKNLSSLFIRIQHAFQVGISENCKLNYANVHFEFPLEVQQYGRTLPEVWEK